MAEAGAGCTGGGAASTGIWTCAPSTAADNAVTTGSRSASVSSPPGRARPMASLAASSRSTRSVRTAKRPSRSAPSRSSIAWLTRRTPDRPSIRALPLTVCASRNSPAMTCLGEECASSVSSPAWSEASRSSTSARKVASSSGSSPQAVMGHASAGRSGG